MLLLSALLLSAVTAQNDLDFWNVERPPDMANIASLEVRYFFFSLRNIFQTSSDIFPLFFIYSIIFCPLQIFLLVTGQILCR